MSPEKTWINNHRKLTIDEIVVIFSQSAMILNDVALVHVQWQMKSA
jgi:hypothetical protein